MTVRRAPELVVAVTALTVTGLPLAWSPPGDPGEWVGAAATVLAGLALALWRLRPRLVLAAGPALFLVCLFLGPDPADLSLLVLMAYAALLAERAGGRAAWAAAAVYVGYTAAIYLVSESAASAW